MSPGLLYPAFWILLWGALYVSDYSLTIACARMYQKGPREIFAHEGSYELTPYYEKDVDALRVLSPRFIRAFLWGVILLMAAYGLGVVCETPLFFPILLGSMVSVELAVHVRHVRNFVTFRAALAGEITGRMTYSRRTMLRLSGAEILSFGALFLVMFVATGSPFVCGGTLGCAVLASKHLWRARKTPSPSPALSRPAG